MKRYLSDWVFATGLALVVLGTGPLLAIILLAKLGFLSDPNPNPIGPGLLSFVTLWPGILVMAAGVRRVRRRGGE